MTERKPGNVSKKADKTPTGTPSLAPVEQIREPELRLIFITAVVDVWESITTDEPFLDERSKKETEENIAYMKGVVGAIKERLTDLADPDKIATIWTAMRNLQLISADGAPRPDIKKFLVGHSNSYYDSYFHASRKQDNLMRILVSTLGLAADPRVRPQHEKATQEPHQFPVPVEPGNATKAKEGKRLQGQELLDHRESVRAERIRAASRWLLQKAEAGVDKETPVGKLTSLVILTFRRRLLDILNRILSAKNVTIDQQHINRYVGQLKARAKDTSEKEALATAWESPSADQLEEVQLWMEEVDRDLLTGVDRALERAVSLIDGKAGSTMLDEVSEYFAAKSEDRLTELVGDNFVKVFANNLRLPEFPTEATAIEKALEKERGTVAKERAVAAGDAVSETDPVIARAINDLNRRAGRSVTMSSRVRYEIVPMIEHAATQLQNEKGEVVREAYCSPLMLRLLQMTQLNAIDAFGYIRSSLSAATTLYDDEQKRQLMTSEDRFNLYLARSRFLEAYTMTRDTIDTIDELLNLDVVSAAREKADTEGIYLDDSAVETGKSLSVRAAAAQVIAETGPEAMVTLQSEDDPLYERLSKVSGDVYELLGSADLPIATRRALDNLLHDDRADAPMHAANTAGANLLSRTRSFDRARMRLITLPDNATPDRRTVAEADVERLQTQRNNARSEYEHWVAKTEEQYGVIVGNRGKAKQEQARKERMDRNRAERNQLKAEQEALLTFVRENFDRAKTAANTLPEIVGKRSFDSPISRLTALAKATKLRAELFHIEARLQKTPVELVLNDKTIIEDVFALAEDQS